MQGKDLKMEQRPINQRLNFLLKSLKISARTFSDPIGESPTNTQNYVGTRNAEPRASYLENVLRHFATINPLWLLTGEGEAFTSEVAEQRGEYQTQSQNQKKNRGTINNHNNHGPTTYTIEDCQRERDQLKATCEAQERELGLLKGQVIDKDEIIQLLKEKQAKP